MSDNPEGQVIENENPAEEEVPGSEPKDGSGGNETPQATFNDTPEAYKGLQRRLNQRDEEVKSLQRQIEELRQANQSGRGLDTNAIKALVTPILQDIAQDDPQRARALAQQIAAQMQQQELQQYREHERAREQERALADAEARNMEELRAIAKDMGADPDSDLIDYGGPTQYLSDRIKKVRETAREAIKPVEPSETPKPNVGQGTAHNPNPGVPTQPRAKPAAPSRAEYQQALLDYNRNPTPAKMAEIRELKGRLQAELEKNLSA